MVHSRRQASRPTPSSAPWPPNSPRWRRGWGSTESSSGARATSRDHLPARPPRLSSERPANQFAVPSVKVLEKHSLRGHGMRDRHDDDLADWLEAGYSRAYRTAYLLENF